MPPRSHAGTQQGGGSRTSFSASVGPGPLPSSLCSSPTSPQHLSKATKRLFPPTAAPASPASTQSLQLMLVSGLLPGAREGSGCPSSFHLIERLPSAIENILGTQIPRPIRPCLCPCQVPSVSVTSVCHTWELVIKYSPQTASLELKY